MSGPSISLKLLTIKLQAIKILSQVLYQLLHPLLSLSVPVEADDDLDDHWLSCDDVAELVDLAANLLLKRRLRCTMSKDSDFIFSRETDSYPEQLEEQVLLPLIAPIVVERENDALEELCGLHLRHREHEPGQVSRVGLQGVEEVLVCVQLLAALLAKCLEWDAIEHCVKVARNVLPRRTFSPMVPVSPASPRSFPLLEDSPPMW